MSDLLGDGEVLFGCRAIAAEVSRLIGREVNAARVAHWARRGVFRAKKTGYFIVTTKSSLREDFQPKET